MDLSQHENILPFNNDDQHVTGGGVGSSIFYFTLGQAIGPVRLYLQWYNLGSSFACLFTRKKTRHKKRLVEDRKMSEEIIIILPY